MLDKSFLTDLLSDIPFDLRAEVVIADLILHGHDLSDLFVQPIGLFKRKFSKDISNIELKELSDYNELMILKVHREGLYDVLPQSIFHYPAKKPKAFKTVKEMVAETKVRLEEEANARNYFFAYESEFFKYRVSTEYHERKLLETITYNMDDDKILSYWDLPNFLTTRQKGILFYLFPIIYRIRSSLRLMEETYSAVLKERITIRCTGRKQEQQKKNLMKNVLGKMILSRDSVLGDKEYHIYENLEIVVGPLKRESIIHYLPDGVNIKVLQHLNSMFLPVTAESEIRIENEKQGWILDSKNKNASRLGFSATLHSTPAEQLS